MSADKSHKHSLYGKLDYHYESITIPAYIKHIVLISFEVGRWEVLANVGKVMPRGILDYVIPSF